MKSFWDSSAVINAAISPPVKARLKQGDHVARLHVLLEFFSTMTGRGLSYQDKAGNPVRILFAPDDAARWLRGFASKVSLIELTGPEILDALDKAQARSIQGGRVYDYAHALAADKVRADEILTRNAADFQGLTKAKIIWP